MRAGVYTLGWTLGWWVELMIIIMKLCLIRVEYINDITYLNLNWKRFLNIFQTV